MHITVGDTEVRVGDLERDATIRLKRLEEELAKSSTFIVEVFDIYNNVNAKNRYLTLEKRDLATSDVGIWGVSDWNASGGKEWGDDFGVVVWVLLIRVCTF